MKTNYIDVSTIKNGLRTGHSCEIGLIKNNKNVIDKFCNYNIFNIPLEQNMIRLNDNEILMIKVKSFEQICDEDIQSKRGCDHCVIKLPHQCDIASDSQQFIGKSLMIRNQSDLNNINYKHNLCKTFHEKINRFRNSPIYISWYISWCD